MYELARTMLKHVKSCRVRDYIVSQPSSASSKSCSRLSEPILSIGSMRVVADSAQLEEDITMQAGEICKSQSQQKLLTSKDSMKNIASKMSIIILVGGKDMEVRKPLLEDVTPLQEWLTDADGRTSICRIPCVHKSNTSLFCAHAFRNIWRIQLELYDTCL